MGEMINIIAGTIERKPSVKQINVLGKTRMISNNCLAVEDEGGGTISVQIAAWDGVAEELLQYDKGDKIHFLGTPNDTVVQHEGSFIPVLGFTVLKIDHDMQITLAVQDKILEAIKKLEPAGEG